tara:strand:+ start:494 stop:805 length:312 start_codon:yes stop_codon:yes gene_type:complete
MKISINKNKFETELLSLISYYILEEIDPDSNKNINLETRLFGGEGLLDSMDLVVLLVKIEEYLEENYNISITLASENAMSRRTSPFVRVKYLLDYIFELVDEK